MVITCLSPVHITDEVGTVYSYQYLYDVRTQRVYFLNERLWVKFLFENNLLPEFEELIKTKMRAGTLCEWLLAKGYDIDALGGAVTEYADVAVLPEVIAANKMRLTEIVRTVHSVDGQPYIPSIPLTASRTYRAAALKAHCARGFYSACFCRRTGCAHRRGTK